MLPSEFHAKKNLAIPGNSLKKRQPRNDRLKMERQNEKLPPILRIDLACILVSHEEDDPRIEMAQYVYENPSLHRRNYRTWDARHKKMRPKEDRRDYASLACLVK